MSGASSLASETNILDDDDLPDLPMPGQQQPQLQVWVQNVFHNLKNVFQNLKNVFQGPLPTVRLCPAAAHGLRRPYGRTPRNGRCPRCQYERQSRSQQPVSAVAARRAAAAVGSEEPHTWTVLEVSAHVVNARGRLSTRGFMNVCNTWFLERFQVAFPVFVR